MRSSGQITSLRRRGAIRNTHIAHPNVGPENVNKVSPYNKYHKLCSIEPSRMYKIWSNNHWVALITAVQSNFVCHFAGYWDWFSCGFPGTFVKAYNEQFLALSASIAKLLFDLCANRSVVQFISSRGNEYFCEIDEDYLTDRFNLTGLNTEVQYYQYALDLVTDVFDLDCDDEMRETIEKSARHLYGLVHARYIVTTRGLAKMVCDHWLTITCFLTCHSLRSTRRQTLGNVPEWCASHILYYRWDNQIIRMLKQSSFIVLNARISTIRNLPAIQPLMEHTLGLPSTTSFSKFTLP